MTAAEFVRVEHRDKQWMELVDGEVIQLFPYEGFELAKQTDVFRRLIVELFFWSSWTAARGRFVPPGEVRVDDANVYSPDLVWYADGRSSEDVREKNRSGSSLPGLVVVCRSARWHLDLSVKRAGYERNGLAELWLVDTKSGTIIVFRRSAADAACFDTALELGSGDRLESSLLPGFSAYLRDIL